MTSPPMPSLKPTAAACRHRPLPRIVLDIAASSSVTPTHSLAPSFPAVGFSLEAGRLRSHDAEALPGGRFHHDPSFHGRDALRAQCFQALRLGLEVIALDVQMHAACVLHLLHFHMQVAGRVLQQPIARIGGGIALQRQAQRLRSRTARRLPDRRVWQSMMKPASLLRCMRGKISCAPHARSQPDCPSKTRCRSCGRRWRAQAQCRAGGAARRGQEHRGAAGAAGRTLGARAEDPAARAATARGARGGRAHGADAGRAAWAKPSAIACGWIPASARTRGSRWSPKASSRACCSRIRRWKAWPRCCSTNSTSAACMPTWVWRCAARRRIPWACHCGCW